MVFGQAECEELTDQEYRRRLEDALRVAEDQVGRHGPDGAFPDPVKQAHWARRVERVRMALSEVTKAA